MRKIIYVLLILLLLLPSNVTAQENIQDEDGINTNRIIDGLIEQVDMHELENTMNQINNEMADFLPETNGKSLISAIAKGEFTFNISDIFTGIVNILFEEIINSSDLLLRIIILSIICAILQNLQNSFENNSVGEMAFNVVYIIILSMSIQSFVIAMQVGINTIDNMVIFMHALLPTLLVLLTSMGAISSAVIFQPVLTLTVTILSTFVKNIVLPLIFFGAILNLVNYISDRVQILRLAELIKQISVVALGFIMTIFIGVMAVQGVITSSFDGITTRTAKYAVDNFIPVVGGFLSDSVDTIIGLSLLIKNAIGVVGLIFLIGIMIFPVLKIVALILIYKVSSAIIEPVVDGKIVNSLGDMAKSLTLVLAAVISVGLMFFLVVTIVIVTGNITVMMR